MNGFVVRHANPDKRWLGLHFDTNDTGTWGIYKRKQSYEEISDENLGSSPKKQMNIIVF